ncbi:MAG: hypothetical protein Q4E05_09750 [Pseudoclavibacter sp.]|nr:hypothetical protein [Pseudoclavibacter sp.]
MNDGRADPWNSGGFGAPPAWTPSSPPQAPSGPQSGAPPFGGGHPFGPPPPPFPAPAQPAPPPVPRGPGGRPPRWAVVASLVAGCLVLVLAIVAVLLGTAPARAERIAEVEQGEAVAEAPSFPDPIPFGRVALAQTPSVVYSAPDWHPRGRLPFEDSEGYEEVWANEDVPGECQLAVVVEADLRVSNFDDRGASERVVENIVANSSRLLQPPSPREQAVVGGGSVEMLSFRVLDPDGVETVVSVRVFAGSGHALLIFGSCGNRDSLGLVEDFHAGAKVSVSPR